MNQPDPVSDAPDSLLTTILGFLLPFFLTAATGNPDGARAAVMELVDAYNSSTPTELDLVGRIIGFSIASLDNLRLSMTPGLPDTKVLRYRCNAVTLSRASDQARKILESLQANQQPRQRIPRPTIAAAPAPKPARPESAQPEPAQPEPAQPEPAQPEPAQPEPARLVSVPRAPAHPEPAHPEPARPGTPAATPAHPPAKTSARVPPRLSSQPAPSVLTPAEIETMQRDARILMNVFSKSPTHGASLISAIPSAATLVTAAVKAAMPGAPAAPGLTAATGTRC